jgi:hypothetical protein
VFCLHDGRSRKMDGRIRESTLQLHNFKLLLYCHFLTNSDRLQTNVISTFMLATLLVPLLLETAKLPAPVENVYLKPHLVVLTSSRKFHSIPISARFFLISAYRP